MKRPVTARLVLFIAAMLAGVTFLLPSMPLQRPEWWNSVFPERGMTLGLDLQGGLHLVLHVDTEAASNNELDRMVQSVLREAKAPQAVAAKAVSARVNVTLNGADAKAIREAAGKMAPDLTVSDEAGALVFAMPAGLVDSVADSALKQSVETLRNRIDQFGVVDPSIQTQGKQKIVIQLPGITDTQRALDLIGQTAVLEFRIVNAEANMTEVNDRINKALELDPAMETDTTRLVALVQDILPPASELIKFQSRDEYGVKESWIVVDDKAQLTGSMLANAGVRFDSQFNEPMVSLEFTPEGSDLFEQITGQNINKQMAIVLDRVARSAPVIRSKIAGGRAQIDGIGSLEEARDVAVVLRAGALPAPVRIEEQLTVGPSLGQDSIDKGVLATAVGSIAVILFMLVYYRMSGVIAIVALGANLVLLLGLLGLFNATLTLPGIAGIALTIGMAVDGNVIIFERIREELRAGKNARSAVATGFDRAFWAIADSNITTIIAGLILYQFGTGPIKGFAVTMTVGILTTLFAVLFVTRLMFDLYLRNRNAETLSI